jgi:hypothetical protein
MVLRRLPGRSTCQLLNMSASCRSLMNNHSSGGYNKNAISGSRPHSQDLDLDLLILQDHERHALARLCFRYL